VTDLLLGLGAAVVKVACKIWLNDNKFAADASAEVVDVVRDKFAGELEQRRARRLFEDLEVPVAEKLAEFREHEFRGMPDNEWEAAVLAVGDSLRRARFRDADIFAGDLDPLYLRRKVSAASPSASRDLSEDGTALYFRLLTECCAYVVELTSTLPRFNAGAFGEVLRRQSVIIQQVAEVLDRMPQSVTPAPGAGQAEADFSAAYRRQVVSQLDRLELFGTTVSDSVRGYPLSTAYIPLAVTNEVWRIKQALNATFSEAFVTLGEETTSSAWRIDHLLRLSSRVFLRGEAGSGKTTLLQWLAVRAARNDFPETLSEWNDHIPFFIRLRRYAAKDLPAPEEFVNEVGRHIAGDMPQGWVHRILRRGSALILVDGLDELPDSQRKPTRDWLTSLVSTFPEAKYVVTSRPGAASSTWLENQSFDAAEVKEMSWPDIEKFVSHWHSAFQTESTDQERNEQISASEDSLLESLNTRRHLRMLATSPLLCALICALNLDRRTQLPEDRMELYEIALEMLLERRDLERLIPHNGVHISRTRKIILLEDLAYWLIRNSWSDASKERAADRISRRLADMPGVPPEDGTSVLNALILRSGLIREPVASRIDFVHRTFQEYLAARAAISDDQCGELINNAHNDHWREVIVMAVGHAQPRQREELLHGVLRRAENSPRNRQSLQTLAVSCLETSHQLAPALHAKIQAVAESQLPPKGVRQAEILARIGEPLLDLLADHPPHGQRQATATIRAASTVGGPAALPIISRCSKIPGISVHDELMRAWHLFDNQEYATKVLSGSPHATNIAIQSLKQMPFLKEISGLRYLTLDFPTQDHFDYIHELPLLEALNIVDGSSISDINPLAMHPNLHRLLIQGRGSQVNLSSIAELPRLREVIVAVNRVKTPEYLRNCPGLNEIGLISPGYIDHIGFYIPEYPLTSFILADAEIPSLQIIPEIQGITQLRLLELNTCRIETSLSGIERWANTLQHLSLKYLPRPLNNLDALISLQKLESIEFQYSKIEDFSALRNISTLRKIRTSSKETIDLSGIQGIKSVTVTIPRRQRITGVELLGEGSTIVRAP